LVDRTIGATAGFVCANRNVGVILAVLPAGADPDILLYFAVWQLPMYTMPAVLTPLYRRIAA
jgi:BASS family bile acid:Na+ symporter